MNKGELEHLLRAAIELAKHKKDHRTDYQVSTDLIKLRELSTRHQNLSISKINVPHDQEGYDRLNRRIDQIEKRVVRLIFDHYEGLTVSFHYCGGRAVGLNFPDGMHNSWGGDWLI
jgi:hypothetical protein